MTTISIHTIAKDSVRLDFHLVQMLKHHIPFADEIVVMEGYSTDSTYEMIRDLDKKVRVIRRDWSATDSYLDYVELGRKECKSEWCIKVDADEFIPEWEWDRLRKYLESCPDVITPIRLRNFYGSYLVHNVNPSELSWPEYKWCIHRNTSDISFTGDGSNAEYHDKPNGFAWQGTDCSFEVHHFGTVRKASVLREKWRTQAIRDQKHAGKYKGQKPIRPLPRWLFRLFPHNWLDPQILPYLEEYRGRVMKIVEEDPAEFTRDGLKVLKHLQKIKRNCST